MIAALALLAACTATDGDTTRCGSERIRLVGIDAPELSRCPRHRTCTPGDGYASKRALERMLSQGEPRIVRMGQDKYRRTLARIYVNGVNVGCQMIEAGFAVSRWGQC